MEMQSFLLVTHGQNAIFTGRPLQGWDGWRPATAHTTETGSVRRSWMRMAIPIRRLLALRWMERMGRHIRRIPMVENLMAMPSLIAPSARSNSSLPRGSMSAVTQTGMVWPIPTKSTMQHSVRRHSYALVEEICRFLKIGAQAYLITTSRKTTCDAWLLQPMLIRSRSPLLRRKNHVLAHYVTFCPTRSEVFWNNWRQVIWGKKPKAHI